MVYWTVTSNGIIILPCFFQANNWLWMLISLKKKKKKKKAQQNIRSHPPTWILPEITAIVAGIAPLFFTIFSTSLATLCRKKNSKIINFF